MAGKWKKIILLVAFSLCFWTQGLKQKAYALDPVFLEDLLHAAERGDVGADYTLGLSFLKGDGVVKNTALALNFLEKAANQDFPPAQNQLGLLYLNGADGIFPDYKQALFWFKKAAVSGNEEARIHQQETEALLEKKPPLDLSLPVLTPETALPFEGQESGYSADSRPDFGKQSTKQPAAGYSSKAGGKIKQKPSHALSGGRIMMYLLGFLAIFYGIFWMLRGIRRLLSPVSGQQKSKGDKAEAYKIISSFKGRI